MLAELLSPRILVVTGKGGVGKTTVAATLGLISAAQGRRTIIVETSGARHVAPLFGVESKGYSPVRLDDRLHTLSVTPEEAIEEYIVQQVKVRKIYELVFRNRVMAPFLDAVPGLHDAVQLGKIFDLHRDRGPFGRRKWDTIIVDAPATGHGLTLLDAARSMMDLTRAGPLYENNRIVSEVLDDPAQTGLVLVALPEEMPVNETLDLWQRLGDGRDRVRLCVLNEVAPRLLDHPEDLDTVAPVIEGSGSPALLEALAISRRWVERNASQDHARTRLEGGLTVPVLDLPHRFRRRLEREDLTHLAESLTASLARPQAAS